MGADYLSFAYAAIVTVGGAIGYVKSGSVPSLAAGLVFGSVLGVGAYQTTQNPNNYMLSLSTSMLLGGLMGTRFYNSKKFMPAGLITAMSVIMVCRFAARGMGLLAEKETPIRNE